MSDHITPQQSSPTCSPALGTAPPMLAVLTPDWGWREVLHACCVTTPSKTQLRHSYHGAISTWALFPTPLLPSGHVLTRAGTHLVFWSAPRTAQSCSELCTPVPQSSEGELRFSLKDSLNQFKRYEILILLHFIKHQGNSVPKHQRVSNYLPKCKEIDSFNLEQGKTSLFAFLRNICFSIDLHPLKSEGSSPEV